MIPVAHVDDDLVGPGGAGDLGQEVVGGRAFHGVVDGQGGREVAHGHCFEARLLSLSLQLVVVQSRHLEDGLCRAMGVAL